MMRINLLVIPPTLVLVLICLPVAAAENEFTMGATTAVRYNDNIANVERGKTDSFAFELGPYFKLDSSGAKYELGASYSPRFSTYTDRGRDDNFTQYVGVHGVYRASDRLKLGLIDVLGIESEADREFNDDNSDVSGNGEKQTLRNALDGSITYIASQRTQLSTKVNYHVVAREDNDLSDSSQIAGRAQGNYAFSARNTFGGGALARSQTVRAGRDFGVGEDRIKNTTTRNYGFFLYAEHRFTPLLSLSGSGGPTWLVSNRANDGRKSDTSLDYFASAELTAEIDRGTVALAYERSGSDFAQSATTFTIDQVSARADWAATTRLILGVSGEWNRREAILKFKEDDFVNEVDQWRAAATVSYQISPSLTSHLTFDYLRQESKQAAKDSDATDRYRVVLRFDYYAKAFRF